MGDDGLFRKRKRRADGSYSESATWWIRFQVAGREHRISTGKVDRREAAREGRRLRAEVEASAGARLERGLTLTQLGVWDVERAQADGVGARQIESIEWCWGHLIAHFGELDPNRIGYDTFEAYVRARREAGARGQSITKEKHAFLRGMRIALRRGAASKVPDLPTVRFDPPREAQAGKHHEVETIRAWLDELGRGDRDAYLQALLLAHTGLRVTEVRSLEAGWVRDAPKGAGVPALLVVPAAAAKTRRGRTVGLTQDALDAVRELEARRGELGGPLCPGDHKKAFAGAARRLGYPRTITPRDLRHAYATLGTLAGDVTAVQAALGHTHLATTQRYLHSTLTRTASTSAHVGELLAGRHPEVGTPADPGVCEPAGTPPKAPAARRTSRVEAIGFEPTTPCLQSRLRDRLDELIACSTCASVLWELIAMHDAEGHVGTPVGTPFAAGGSRR